MAGEHYKPLIEGAMIRLGAGSDLSFRPMFGGITAYVDGRNFASLSGVGLALKLSAADLASLLELPGTRPLQYAPDAPVSRQMALLSKDIVGDPQRLTDWIAKSVAHVRGLPTKKPRKT